MTRSQAPPTLSYASGFVGGLCGGVWQLDSPVGGAAGGEEAKEKEEEEEEEEAASGDPMSPLSPMTVTKEEDVPLGIGLDDLASIQELIRQELEEDSDEVDED